MSDSDQPTVVVIDDDESVRESLRGLLETISVDVAVFRSVEAFLSATPPVLPSCIVLDVRLPGIHAWSRTLCMPEMTGLELHQHLVALNHSIPTILITAYPDGRLWAQALKAKVACCLVKPFAAEELLACIHFVITSRGGAE